MMPADFHFLRPYLLLLLIPLVLVCWRLWKIRGNDAIWKDICDAELLQHLLVQNFGSRNHWGFLMFTLAAILSITALSGPVWKRLPVPAFRDQSSLVILLDLSRSMDAADLKPSRLERARFKIDDLLTYRKAGQTALIVYAGHAFTVTPLTDDVDTIRSQIKALETGLMPVQGGQPVKAVRLAMSLMQQAGLQRGDILMVTDGIEPADTDLISSAIGKNNFRLSILGVGSSEGAPIPQVNGGFVKDREGNIVLSQLDSQMLALLAENNGGTFHLLETNDDDIEQLSEYFDTALPNAEQSSSAEIDRWQETGPWLLLPVLLISVFGFRRGLLMIVIMPVFLHSQPAAAFEWNDLWQTPDQQAHKIFEHDPVKAAEMFQNNDWQAASSYRNKNYQEALKRLNNNNTAEDHYNRGNSLARLGQYDEAIKAYDQSLELQPDNDDAKFNRELLEKQSQQESQQQPDDEPSSEDDEQKNDQQDQGSDNSSSNQQNNSQQSDNKPQDQDAEDSETDNNNQQEPSSEEDQQAQQSENNSEKEQEEQSEPSESSKSASEATETNEQDIATEQWLRRIPDDPGGLLRRKFMYQYKQLQSGQNPSNKSW